MFSITNVFHIPQDVCTGETHCKNLPNNLYINNCNNN